MPKRPRTRDRRYSRTIGEKPFIGRRYVENGKVRIEWEEHGRRRRRTVGPNSAATRRQADVELEEILAAMKNNEEQYEQVDQEQQDQQATDSDEQEQQEKRLPPLGDVLRDYALTALDVADGIAEWVHEAITSPVEWEWLEDEEDAGDDDEDDEDDGDDGDDGDDEDDGDDKDDGDEKE